MTTDISFGSVADLGSPNGIFQLNEKDLSAQLSAISVFKKKKTEESWDQLTKDIAKAAVKLVTGLALLNNHQWHFFAASETWAPISMMSKAKGLWNSCQSLAALSGAAIERTRVESFELSGKIRFAGALKLPIEMVPEAVNWCRKSRSGILSLSRQENSRSIKTINDCFDIAFTEARALDIAGLCSAICKTEDMLVRCSGSFDDIDGAIDFIYDSNELPLPVGRQ